MSKEKEQFQKLREQVIDTCICVRFGKVPDAFMVEVMGRLHAIKGHIEACEELLEQGGA